MSQFFATKKTFANIIGFDNTDESLSYESWMSLPDSYKSAALFVNFYPHVKAAWNSAKGPCVDEEDGIETVLQYLEKNVEKIKGNPNRYNSNYIYAVAWNSMSCLRRTYESQLRARFQCSNVVVTPEEGEIDLFDTIVDYDSDMEPLVTKQELYNDFWRTIETMFVPRDAEGNLTDDAETVLECRKYEKVINNLMNGDGLSKARAATMEENPDDPILPISVSRADAKRIIDELRIRLADYKEAILGTDLIPATKEDIIPIASRKPIKPIKEIYAYICKTTKLTVEDAIRLFAVTADGYNKIMQKLIAAGEPLMAHTVKGDNNKAVVDYYYVIG